MIELGLEENKTDQSLILRVLLDIGLKILCDGFGTFGSDSVSHQTAAMTVEKAIYSANRSIDCAPVYGNERDIGIVLNEISRRGLHKREDSWISSRVWNDIHGSVAESCRQSLDDLQTNCPDPNFVHWPFSNFHPPKCDISSRSQNVKPYVHDNYMKTWRQMEQLRARDLLEDIGT